MPIRLACLLTLVTLFCVEPSPARADLIVEWQAASGLRPDQISTPWTLDDTASPEDPVLNGVALTLATSSNIENMYYSQSAPILDTRSAFFIETRVRYVSGSTSSSSRAPIFIGLTVDAGVGNALFIDQDSVFFNSDSGTPGTKINVDTNDAFHTYRIDYNGSGGLTLSYDGNQILTGATFNDAGFNGLQQRIFWGEGSLLATGVSEWTFFRHNAGIAAVPEPSALTLIAATSSWLIIGCRRRNRRVQDC